MAEDEIVNLKFPSAKRKNIPPSGLEARGNVIREQPQKYDYNPHLPPVLRYDPSGKTDALPELIETAGRRPLTAEEQTTLTQALQNHQPWLEWTGKREQSAFEVDPVGLHIHERVSTKAILATAARKDIPRSLFADPEQEYREAVQFYQHDVDWANRLILGDSLQVMASLATREALAGRVQTIYIDPPYGIKYSSNFQPEIRNRDVKDKPNDLTREPEMVTAYRDTWTLGVHSYLSYLRDRLAIARELLTDSGSIFVQISDENKHRVRAVMDDIFGAENYCVEIAYVKTSGLASQSLDPCFDTILWYAKDRSQVRYRQIYRERNGAGAGGGEHFSRGLTQAGWLRSPACAGDRLLTGSNMTSQSGGPLNQLPVELEGRLFCSGKRYWSTNSVGIGRLARTHRILPTKSDLRFIRFIDDFPAFPLNNLWEDTGGGAGNEKVYVVQNGTKAIQRCLLMTTDPGDLILDPTCGSGTTAYVAEQWGRRWITIDCSRVAIAIARQRLITSKFDFYELRGLNAEDLERNPDGTWLGDPTGAIKGACTFDCKTVPHITLKSIARNEALDGLFEKWDPILAEKLAKANAALEKCNIQDLQPKLNAKLEAKKKRKNREDPVNEADERRWQLPPKCPGRNRVTEVPEDFAGWYDWEIPFDTDPDYPEELSLAIEDYRANWKAKMKEVNACIDARAEQEELVDQPRIDRKILRVCSPFTVEGIIPPEESIAFETDSPIGGEPNELDVFDSEESDAEMEPPEEDHSLEPQNAETFIGSIIRLLRSDGVRFPNNRVIKFDRLEASNIVGIHGEGEWTSDDNKRKVAVVIGPKQGSLTAKMVEEGIRIAARRGYDDLVFASLTFDAIAQATIQEDQDPHLKLHVAQIRPDVVMGDLLKTTASSQIFTVSGMPRTHVTDLNNGEYQVEMEGVDIYDPINNTTHSTGAEKVAAWFLDSDYDGRCFCITQAFFPDKKAWDKLSKALNDTVDPDRFEAFSGKKSLPFKKGKHGRVAVKVIDPRGNEVMRLHKIGEGEL